MPQVPYSPVPEVAPDSGGIRLPAGAAPADGIAGEIIGLGKVLSSAGDEVFHRAVALQDLANQTEAKEADAKYMIEAGQLHAEFNSLQGKAAKGSYPQYQKDLQAARNDIRGSLSNDMARKMFDSASLNTMGRTIFNGASHAASQYKSYVVGTAVSQMDLDAKSVEDNPQDDVLFQSKLQRARANVKTIAGVKGLGDGSPQEQELLLKTQSQLWSQRIIGLSRTAPFDAAKMLGENRTELTQADYLKVDTAVRSQSRVVGSINIANQVYADGMETPTRGGKSLKDMEAEATAKANELDPNDPLLAQHAVAALRGKFNQDKYATRQEELTNVQTVDEAIRAGVKNEQELRLNPKVATAIDALPASKRLGIPAAINRYNASRDQTTKEESFLRLKGIANNDVEAFLNTDITKEPLSKGDMDRLMTLQAKLKATATADPRVNRAMTQLRGSIGAQLEALGVFSRTEKNKDEYDRLTGSMQSALDIWQETHGKPATAKDINDTIAPQLLREQTVQGWLWNSKTPFFNQEPPANFKEGFTTFRKSQGRPEPSDAEVQKAFVRAQLMKLYGKKQPNE